MLILINVNLIFTNNEETYKQFLINFKNNKIQSTLNFINLKKKIKFFVNVIKLFLINLNKQFTITIKLYFHNLKIINEKYFLIYVIIIFSMFLI